MVGSFWRLDTRGCGGLHGALFAQLLSATSSSVSMFRCGEVDGSEWFMANGLAQGCPGSPDLMSILFEPFHRWAAVLCKGVAVSDTFICLSQLCG